MLYIVVHSDIGNSRERLVNFPNRKAIYEHIGMKTDLIADVFLLEPFFGGEILLLCTDGLKDVLVFGKEILRALENLLMTVKANPTAVSKATENELKLLVSTMKYSKSFGVSTNANVTELETDICMLIDELEAAAAAGLVKTLKQKMPFAILC